MYMIFVFLSTGLFFFYCGIKLGIENCVILLVLVLTTKFLVF